MQKSVPLLDRSEELSRLDRAWEAANSKQAVLVFISGGPGSGKTTILNEWVERTQPAVHIKVDFSGNLGATTSTLIEAFQLVLKEFAEDSLQWKKDLLASLGREGSGIREVFPNFAGNSWFQPIAMLLDGEQLNRRFLQLLKSLILVWSRCYGTILFTVENLHLADLPLRGLLLQLSQDKIPMLCIATSRESLTECELAGKWLLDRIALAPFSSEEVRLWIGQLFPSESAQRLEFYGELCEHAKGNPLHLHEILRAISHQQASEMVRVSLDTWLDQKVRDLQPEVRLFLEAGSILGSTFRTTMALECSGLNPDLDQLASEGAQLRFVKESGESCIWIHDLIRDAMLRSIDPLLNSTVSSKAVLHIIRGKSQTQERLLMFPAFFRRGHDSLHLTAEELASAKQLFLASSNLMRRMMNLSGARDTLDILRAFMTEQGLAVPHEIWMMSAEVAFESGEIAKCIQFLQGMGNNVAPVLRTQRELMLCRCFYVARNFTAIFKRIKSFASVLWPARLLSVLGPAGVGFIYALLIPLLMHRMKKLSPARVSRRRQLTEHLHIALLFFVFQHYHTLSAAIGLLFVFSSLVQRQSFNFPMAGAVAGMFQNLPRFAIRPSVSLSVLANEKQPLTGNPFWNARFEFLYTLFYLPHISGVKEMWASYQRLVTLNDSLSDPEVETIVKMDLRLIYFWSNVSIAFVYKELQHHAAIAEERGNVGLATVLKLLDHNFEPMISGGKEPYLLFADPLEEAGFFKDLHKRKEFFVESGFRFIQALFALLVGNWKKARDYVLSAAEVPRDTSYWIPRIFDGYIECIARILGDSSDSIKVPYRILESTAKHNFIEFQPYLTHVDAERARRKGLRDSALLLYQKARAEFHRLDRPVLAALVDWRTGDLFWEQSEQQIAQAYLERAMQGFAACDMNSSVNAIRSQYGLETPDKPATDSNSNEYLTVALRLHRLTLLGKLAAETAHEIKNVNHAIRMSADLMRNDIDSLREQSDNTAALASAQHALRTIQDSAGKIDLYVNQFRLSGTESSSRAMGPIDLAEVLHNTVSVMEPVIRRYTRRFKDELSAGQALISGQATKIEQVVMNLILNACESLGSTEQGIVLRWASDSEGQRVGFELSDEGCGISEELLGRITEPFFTTKREKGGTGLGLAVCKSIVEEYKGQLEIQSRLGVGTTVRVLFPSSHERGSA